MLPKSKWSLSPWPHFSVLFHKWRDRASGNMAYHFMIDSRSINERSQKFSFSFLFSAFGNYWLWPCYFHIDIIILHTQDEVANVEFSLLSYWLFSLNFSYTESFNFLIKYQIFTDYVKDRIGSVCVRNDSKGK